MFLNKKYYLKAKEYIYADVFYIICNCKTISNNDSDDVFKRWIQFCNCVKAGIAGYCAITVGEKLRGRPAHMRIIHMMMHNSGSKSSKSFFFEFIIDIIEKFNRPQKKNS